MKKYTIIKSKEGKILAAWKSKDEALDDMHNYPKGSYIEKQ